MNDNQDWRAWAACRDEDPDWWFTNATAGTYIYGREVKRAKDICQTCPVIDDCLRAALREGHADGVWGGTTAELRRWLRKPRPGQPVTPPPRRQHRGDEIARRGQQAIRDGMSVHQAAVTFEVTPDTARRWRRKALEGQAS